uniref:C2H2-type domain-containing protein n=1 Tax=Oryza punctata TaxID=4537 RepID=A0A0E0JQ13_ORYPU
MAIPVNANNQEEEGCNPSSGNELEQLGSDFYDEATNSIELAKAFWTNMSELELSAILSVEIEELEMTYYRGCIPPFELHQVPLLSDTISFIQDTKSWVYWVCPNCERMLLDSRGLLLHLENEHLPQLPRSESIIPRRISDSDISGLKTFSWLPGNMYIRGGVDGINFEDTEIRKTIMQKIQEVVLKLMDLRILSADVANKLTTFSRVRSPEFDEDVSDSFDAITLVQDTNTLCLDSDYIDAKILRIDSKIEYMKKMLSEVCAFDYRPAIMPILKAYIRDKLKKASSCGVFDQDDRYAKYNKMNQQPGGNQNSVDEGNSSRTKVEKAQCFVSDHQASIIEQKGTCTISEESSFQIDINKCGEIVEENLTSVEKEELKVVMEATKRLVASLPPVMIQLPGTMSEDLASKIASDIMHELSFHHAIISVNGQRMDKAVDTGPGALGIAKPASGEKDNAKRPKRMLKSLIWALLSSFASHLSMLLLSRYLFGAEEGKESKDCFNMTQEKKNREFKRWLVIRIIAPVILCVAMCIIRFCVIDPEERQEGSFFSRNGFINLITNSISKISFFAIKDFPVTSQYILICAHTVSFVADLVSSLFLYYKGGFEELDPADG